MEKQLTTTTPPVTEPKKVDTLEMARSCKGRCDIRGVGAIKWCINCEWAAIGKPKN